jgi:8-oxo-dGTP diphosphatase
VSAAAVHTVRAAGGVLWRPAGTGTGTTETGGGPSAEVALVHRPRYDDWSLPKGKLDDGEHPIVGACREVVEETGIHPVVGARLPTVAYQVPTKNGIAPKTVDYWAMRAAGTDHPFVPNDEVDALDWLPPDAARVRLSYQHDAEVLAAFMTLPPTTGVVLLIRHARAGERKRWRGDDALRPLDEVGRAQAARIGEALPWFGPTRIISPDLVRVLSTCEPLAAALGLPIELDPDFGEETHEQDPERSIVRIRGLAAGGGVVAVCSQGGVIPDAVERIAKADGVPLASAPSRKGSVWVLSFHGTTLAAADYLPDLEP